MHKCALFQKVNGYLDGQLSDSEKTEFEKHLAECNACAQEISRLKRVSEQMQAWQTPEASQGFDDAVRNKIVAWELERGDEKMKKTISILIPSGVIAGILVFLVVGRMHVIPLQPQAQLPKVKQAALPTPAHLPTAPVVQNITPVQRTPPPGLPVKAGMMLQESMPVRGTHNALIANGAVTYGYNAPGKVSYDMALSSSQALRLSQPGAQYPPQSEFFEDEYARIYDNDFHLAKQDPLSTFSIDVDTASYSNMRHFLASNVMPPEDAVRIEEMVNYFAYDYPQPAGTDPFSVTTEVAACPWNTAHNVVLIGLQGKKIDTQNLPPANLVFLIDSSGSMQDYNKMPLLKEAFRLLVEQLRPQDTISIVAYADNPWLVLDSAKGNEKEKILQAIVNLNANGSTNGAAGIMLAYDVAKRNFVGNGNNRVILATDGDFNVGITSNSDLVRLIEERRNDGIFLTILGFGMGNYKDSNMEQLADKGNGNAAYIDNLLEAKKVLVRQLGGTLFTIAKDVKIQVEFNPGKVKAYRLIGYEDRKLENKDFNDDKKDAGEIGAGHTVTALYEIVPADSNEELAKTDDLKYQQVNVKPSDELLTVKLRYKEPDGDTSKLLTKTIKAAQIVANPSENFTFATSVAEFGLLLRNSTYKAQATYQDVIARAKASKGEDPDGDRADFIRLVETAQMIDHRTK